ncbi:phospholipid carrier-dependent glycosyltransferase [Actinoplanes sp. CA-142083]|uniref:phospholipid carrier-dependent glycosyltransferase n=1 Tax=Actinoplanes sp. CA-142083 TaxID=3239903 RepID=UPI003D9158C0
MSVADGLVGSGGQRTYSYPKRLLAALGVHWPLLVVLGAATAMRAWFVYAYPYAFFFPDSGSYALSAVNGYPNQIRPWGYSGLITPFLDQPYIRIAIIQHVIGLAITVAGYAFLRRRGVRPWLSALAMVPFALDARVLTIEHYILAETAYIAFTAAGLFLIAWRDKVGWLAASLGGLLLAAAALTRSVGLPILALAGVYLLVRRIGILRLVAFVVPVVALLGGYMTWYHQHWGVYSMGQFQGRFLYARVMPIADCAKLKLTEEQRPLCMASMPGSREDWKQRPDGFIWSTASPAYRLYPEAKDDPILQKFAVTVIKQQPGDYVKLVAEQTGWHLWWRPPINGSAECLATQWLPPSNPGDLCQARYYLPVEPGRSPPPNFLVDNPQAKALSAYGEQATTPGPLYAVGVVVALFAAVWRARRRPWRDAADALMFTAAGFGLLIVSVATSLFDYRYAEPAVLFIPVGLALSINRIAALAKTPARAAVVADEPAPSEEPATVPLGLGPAAATTDAVTTVPLGLGPDAATTDAAATVPLSLGPDAATTDAAATDDPEPPTVDFERAGTA